ncbi:rod shape-determining protein MreD [Roseimarinus sediminis]|jgi:rod shape-determining protein MreD|uniref:rod shape-determining protein MreD n=1 Tax=Roseimarinus sediminis TaxID=1610899 RepID=UPI003D25C278
MNKGILWYVLLFVFVVLVQVLMMNHIQFSGLVNPYFYVLFILLLPASTPRYLLLILGFVLGLTIDVFSNTPGIHASSTVFMAFIRPFVINSSIVDDQDRVMIPSLMNLGVSPFLRYAAFTVSLHHLFLFYVEIFSFTHWHQTLFRGVLSALFTLVFIVISQFLVFRK